MDYVESMSDFVAGLMSGWPANELSVVTALAGRQPDQQPVAVGLPGTWRAGERAREHRVNLESVRKMQKPPRGG